MTEPIDLNARRERRDDREDHEIQAGFAFEHVRKGFYDDADLALLGITRAEAEEYQRERQQRLGFVRHDGGAA